MYELQQLGLEILLSLKNVLKNVMYGTSLAVQWLRLHTSTSVGTVSIPGRETKILHAVPRSQKKK